MHTTVFERNVPQPAVVARSLEGAVHRPFWIDDLRGSTGLDAEVRDYVLSREGAQEFLDAYTAALRPILEGYQRENKSHSTVAIGCTGGKHRSVAMVEELAVRLGQIPGVAVTVRHRDLGRE